jgi:Kef-type K+ transport system membrane component KefB
VSRRRILLGPSFLGLLSPETYRFLLPVGDRSPSDVVAQIGVIIYMFLIGLELNPELLRNRVKATLVISTSSILLPFLLGVGLAMFIYDELSPSNVPFTPFALFLGLSMSVTAFSRACAHTQRTSDSHARRSDYRSDLCGI